MSNESLVIYSMNKVGRTRNSAPNKQFLRGRAGLSLYRITRAPKYSFLFVSKKNAQNSGKIGSLQPIRSSFVPQERIPYPTKRIENTHV